ncbi:MAG TPA: hypothetical protein VIL71_05265 [Spirillospora sp.]
MDTGPVPPRRPGEIRHTPAHGIPSARATPVDGTPIHAEEPAAWRDAPRRTVPDTPVPPGAPEHPIAHDAPGREETPRIWGRPPTGPQPRVTRRETVAKPQPHPTRQEAVPQPETRGGAGWPRTSEAQDRYQGQGRERSLSSSSTGPMGVRETSGVQVRLGRRERHAQRRERERGGRRGWLVAVGVLVLTGLVTAGLVLTGGPGGGGKTSTAAGRNGPGGVAGPLPPAGTPVEVGTADGARYRLATVGNGIGEDAAGWSSAPPSGTAFPYIEYLLTNPTNDNVLLDFPGDVFVKRRLVTAEARGRCMPQAGVPEDMCTPPTRSEVVRRVAGRDLIPGDGGDKYLPPGSTVLVRATVDVPVDSDITRADMGLYVWKQLYMADQLAKLVPFPR